MNPEAGIAEPPPQTTQGADPQGGPASPGLAAAAAAQAEFDRTGKAPEGYKGPGQPAKKDPPAKKEEGAKKDEPASDKKAGAIGEIKPKTAAPAKSEEQIKKEAAAKEEALKKAQPGAADEEQKQQTRWKELKAKEEELERKEAFTDVTKTKRYQDEVETPFSKIQDKAEEVATYAGIELRVLMKAMQEPNALLRADKIKEVLEGAKKEVRAENLAILVQHGDELKDIFAKMDKFQKEADTEKAQWENEQKAEKLRVETETQQIRETAQKEALSILKTNASDVLTEEMLTKAFERSKIRRSEPMDDAFRDVSEFLVPSLIELNRDKDTKIAELQADLEAALASRPGIEPTKDKKAGKEAPYASLKEAAAAEKAAGGQF
jgi:hypothetical protein